MRKLSLFALTFLAALSLFSSANAAERESAFNHVVRTNTLRCSYVVLPPQLIRDPNSGQFSGIAYDIVMEAANRLNLKVEWVEEVNFATMGEGFRTGRYDAFCFTAYRWLPSAKAMAYTQPIFYTTTSAYTRFNNKRFDNHLEAINNEKVTVATLDGESSTTIKEQDFPKAKSFSLPQTTDLSQMLESVVSGKADVAFANPLVVMPYLMAKPDSLHRVETTSPLRIHGHALAFGSGEQELLNMFNMALDEMRADGFIDRVLNKYEKIPHSFVRISPPFK